MFFYHLSPATVIMSFNHADCGTLKILFPVSPPDPTPILSENPICIVVQALPAAIVLLFWIFAECKGKKQPSTRFCKSSAAFIIIVSIAVQSLLIWHTFEIIKCEASFNVNDWAIVTVLANAIAIMFLLYILLLSISTSGYTSRLPTLIFILLAGCALFADWCLRGGFVTSKGSHLFVAIQQTYAIQAVSSLYFLSSNGLTRSEVGNRMTTPRPTSHTSTTMRPQPESTRVERQTQATRVEGGSILRPIDSLARRIESGECVVPGEGDRDRSWFVV
jgi:hypothetical protein